MSTATKRGEHLYKDVPGWFTEETATSLDKLIVEHDISQVIEIGSYLGRSAVFFASRVLETLCIDPFVMWPDLIERKELSMHEGEDFYDKFLDNIKHAMKFGPNTSSIKATRKTSEQAFYDNPDLYADLIYIDGQHDYESVKNDIRMWGLRAKKVICGDDYDVHWPGVMQAVDEAYPDRVVEGNFWYKII